MSSHTDQEIKKALEQGLPVWKLDTDGHGEDDILIGEYSEVLADVLYYHDISELPDDWELTQIGDWYNV
jgi:hypothetical protein